MKTVCYMRMSISERYDKRLREEIQTFANSKNLGEVAFVEENASGRVDLEKRLPKVLEELKHGDNLIVSDVTRLSRSSSRVREAMQIIKKKGANLHVVRDD